jgi:hypothetical protein
VKKKLKLKVVSSAELALTKRQFSLPNPGDMIIMMVFGWAMVCFFLVTVGKRLLASLARLASDDAVREALLNGDQALGGLMIGGSLLLGVTVAIVYKFPKLFLPVMVFSLAFASARYKPLHDVAWILKYLGVVFLGAYAAQSIYKNFWRFLAIPFMRLILAWVAWVGIVCIFIGGRNDDFWYLGTEISYMLGFAVVWVYGFNNKYGLEEFNRLLSWAAVAILATHLMAPILVDTYIHNGRFQSYFQRATAFGVAMSPITVVLFWRAMSDKNPQTASFFSIAALLAFGLILWSGSRSPTAATMMGVGILWWLFRSRLLLVMIIFAVMGAAGQLILMAGSAGGLEQITDRMQTAETGRTIIWGRYFEVALGSPIYGYSPSGMRFATIGGSLGELLAERNSNFTVRGVHNAYLGIVLRFGLVGLFLFLALMVSAARRAKNVLFSRLIPEEEKRNYILPAALIPVFAFVCIFEDKIPGQGKGTLEGFLLYPSIFICQVYGARLINVYERTGTKTKPIETIEAMKVLAPPSLPASKT